MSAESGGAMPIQANSPEFDDDANEQPDTVEVDETEEPDEATGSEDEWTPPTREEWEAKMGVLKKLRQFERQAKRGKADESADEDATSKAAAEVEARYKPIVVRQAARAAFAEAGLLLPKGREDSAVKKALKLIDMDDLDITEDGDVDGLADQIADIKADYPELFARARASRIDSAPKSSSGVSQPKTSAEVLADALLGGR